MTARRRGLLVALEGIDGSGKSTLQRLLARRWRAEGYPVACLHEPFDRALGSEALRTTRENPSWAAVLFTLDRWVGRPRVRAALGRPAIVLLDRSFYSTLAYQGSALSAKERRELDRLQRGVTEVPDRVVWVRVPVREALRRVSRRGRRRAIPEQVDFLTRVDLAYAGMARNAGWIGVDGRQPPSQVAEEVVRRLVPVVRRRLGPARRHA